MFISHWAPCARRKFCVQYCCRFVCSLLFWERGFKSGAPTCSALNSIRFWNGIQICKVEEGCHGNQVGNLAKTTAESQWPVVILVSFILSNRYIYFHMASPSFRILDLRSLEVLSDDLQNYLGSRSIGTTTARSSNLPNGQVVVVTTSRQSLEGKVAFTWLITSIEDPSSTHCSQFSYQP